MSLPKTATVDASSFSSPFLMERFFICDQKKGKIGCHFFYHWHINTGIVHLFLQFHNRIPTPAGLLLPLTPTASVTLALPSEPRHTTTTHTNCNNTNTTPARTSSIVSGTKIATATTTTPLPPHHKKKHKRPSTKKLEQLACKPNP